MVFGACVEIDTFPHLDLSAFCEFAHRQPVTWQQTAGKQNLICVQNSCANDVRYFRFLHVLQDIPIIRASWWLELSEHNEHREIGWE